MAIKEFSPGEKIRAADFNDNFEHLEDEINSFKPDYIYDQTVEFLSSGTFTKANYPNAKMFVFRIQGGGGGGGGFPSGTVRGGTGGAGGGFAVVAKTPASLNASEPITVGLGGTGGVSSTDGTSGGNSSAVGVTAFGGGGGASYKGNRVHDNGGLGGPFSGTRHYSKRGVDGGNSHQTDTTNCGPNSFAAGRGGAGGAGEYAFFPLVFDFDEPPTNKIIGATSAAGTSFANNGSSPGNENPKTTNTGNGGGAVGVNCTGVVTGYGAGGDNGFVKVDIYV